MYHIAYFVAQLFDFHTWLGRFNSHFKLLHKILNGISWTTSLSVGLSLTLFAVKFAVNWSIKKMDIIAQSSLEVL